jgi:LPXTG-motif cell wall-anchored protein
MTHSQYAHQRVIAFLSKAVLGALAIVLLFAGVAHAQDVGSSITPSFGDGKLKILGEGFKPNEKVTITVKIDAGTSTFNATADAQGAFELDTGLDLAPGSSVELDARGDQGSGSASITSVPPALPLPQTGADLASWTPIFVLGILLAVAGLVFAVRSAKHA